jgi:hypothetical protein
MDVLKSYMSELNGLKDELKEAQTSKERESLQKEMIELAEEAMTDLKQDRAERKGALKHPGRKANR